MAEIIFYEKPGCINNTKQKRMLAFAGHVVIAKNLLEEAWSSDRLHPFFSSMPVNEWFNRSAPQVRDGEVDPDKLEAAQAFELFVSTPLLIRRPLMIVDGEHVVGFDAVGLNQRFNLGLDIPQEDIEACPRTEEHIEGCEVKA